MTDHELIQRVAQDGSHEAFEELDHRYRGKLRSFILGRCGDTDVAAEIAEEALVRVYLKAGRYRPLATVSTWIFTIAENCLRNHWRRQARTRDHLIIDPSPVDEDAMPVDPPDPLADPSRDAEWAELNDQIAAAMATIPPHYRVALELKADGLTYDEITEVLGIPLGTVRSRIFRARGMLRRSRNLLGLAA